MKIIELGKTADEDSEVYSELKKRLYSTEDQQKLSNANPFTHPYFYKAFVLIADEKPIAHAALYNNPYLSYEGEKSLCIGNYECEDNQQFSKAFLRHLVYETRQNEATYLIGPMNGSTWDSYRFCDTVNISSFFLEPYNKTYYNSQFTEAGFKNIANYFSAIDEEMNYQNPALLRKENDLNDQGIVFRNMDLDNYENELKKVYILCLEAFAGNFLYTPITWEDFKQKYYAVLRYIDPDFVLLAEDANKELIGFVFCLPNYLNKQSKQLIIKTIARKKGRQYAGLGDILGNKITEIAKSRSYNAIIHALMYSRNSSMNLSKKHAGKIIQTYSLYAAKV